jgi:trimeric autotransporter adhesin
MRANTSTAKVWNATSKNVGGTVANSLQLTSTGTASQVIGLLTANAAANWTSNTVRNLTNNNSTGTTTAASVIGMSVTTTTPNHTLAQNTIFNLSNSNTTAATIVTGIQFTGATTNVVARNLIYGLTSATNSATAEVNGIRVAGGTTIYRNDMIALGAGITNALGGVASRATRSTTTPRTSFPISISTRPTRRWPRATASTWGSRTTSTARPGAA